MTQSLFGRPVEKQQTVHKGCVMLTLRHCVYQELEHAQKKPHFRINPCLLTLEKLNFQKILLWYR